VLERRRHAIEFLAAGAELFAHGPPLRDCRSHCRRDRPSLIGLEVELRCDAQRSLERRGAIIVEPNSSGKDSRLDVGGNGVEVVVA
jgi:hypothetical protein